jgi:DNA-binding CsgD family transcriptional regulator
MDQITTDRPTMHPLATAVEAPHHDVCLTLDVTSFLLGRVSMEEVCQFCVLTALAPLHPWHMSIYVVDRDSRFRVVGTFGKGSDVDVLNRYSCLDDPHVGAELRGGRPLATFPLVGMRPEQHLNISHLQDGPQVLWPLSTAHGLVGVIHVRFSQIPDAHAVSRDIAAIAGPITLAIDLAASRDHITAPPSSNGQGSNGQVGSHTLTEGSLAHPSLMGPVAATGNAAPRPLSVVRWGGQDMAAGETLQAPPVGSLTARQLRVLSLMAKGMTNGQIARVLAFSESTVRQETMAIYRTLHVKGRAEAIDYGHTNGLIPTTP